MFPAIKSFSIIAGLTAALASIAVPRPAQAGHPPDKLARLISILETHPDSGKREDAAEELGELGDIAALPALERAARRDRYKCVRDEACDAIKAIRGNHERLRGLVHKLLRDRDEGEREDAAEDLADYGTPAVLPHLEYAAGRDPCKDVREEARDAIKCIRKRFGM